MVDPIPCYGEDIITYIPIVIVNLPNRALGSLGNNLFVEESCVMISFLNINASTLELLYRFLPR